MREYTIVKISGQPDWEKIPSLSIDNLLWTQYTDVSAKAQLCWDDAGIFVRMSAVEKDIRMENTGVLDSVCDDSCLEFFLQPTEVVSYINIEMNPNCAVFLGFGSCLENLIRLIPEDWEVLYPKSEMTADGWNITYKVPFSFLQQFYPTFQPKSGLKMKGNFYKCGDLTPNPHFLSWNNITCETPAFHVPQYFGTLILG